MSAASVDGIAPRPTLARIISQRLALTSLVAIALQVCVVAVQYYADQDQFTLDYVGRETALLVRGVVAGPSGLKFTLPANASHFAVDTAHYAYRIQTSDELIAASGDGEHLNWASPSVSKRLELWFHRLPGEEWLSFAGGQRYTIGGRDVWIEVATLGDPLRRHWWVLALELSKLVWLPMLPLIVLLLGVALFSVTRLLRPLAKASEQAEHMSLLESSERFDLSGMTREVASFAAATNRLLDRSSDLLTGQKMFIAKAAHELRTPLAIMTLELAKIADPRARRLEADVAAMSEMVDRLLLLGRLGTLKARDFSQFDLRDLLDEVAEHIRPWVQERGHGLLCERGPQQMMTGDITAVREAVRNLIENAVKHTPRGCNVVVRIDGEAAVTVEDNGNGFRELDSSALTEPFAKGSASSDGTGLGLAIVRQAVDLHGGRLEIGRSALGGAYVRLDFVSRDQRRPDLAGSGAMGRPG